jgi:two-component sensor histidine kinase
LVEPLPDVLVKVELLAQAVIDTIRDPLLVLDKDFRVVAASRSYYLTYETNRQATQGQMLSALGGGRWDISALQTQLDRISPQQSVLEAFEVEVELPRLGRRLMLLNARRLFSELGDNANILLAIEDITERRAAEDERDDLLRQKDVLLAEIEHRIANSLAIIASILLLKARTVKSAETRTHLEDAHKRVISVAAVQKHLHAANAAGSIEVGPYLTQLCRSLGAAVVNEDQCEIQVHAPEGAVLPNAAVSIGLIVTELVINALKHAFPDTKRDCTVVVKYEVNGTDWRLTVSDNGVGKSDIDWPPSKSGLGTGIVQALAAQLDARVDIESGSSGTSVSVAHSTFQPRPLADS